MLTNGNSSSNDTAITTEMAAFNPPQEYVYIAVGVGACVLLLCIVIIVVVVLRRRNSGGDEHVSPIVSEQSYFAGSTFAADVVPSAPAAAAGAPVAGAPVAAGKPVCALPYAHERDGT